MNEYPDVINVRGMPESYIRYFMEAMKLWPSNVTIICNSDQVKLFEEIEKEL